MNSTLNSYVILLNWFHIDYRIYLIILMDEISEFSLAFSLFYFFLDDRAKRTEILPLEKMLRAPFTPGVYENKIKR